MGAQTTPVCEFGWEPPAFTLPATDGKTYAFTDIIGPGGTLVMFICNHCPYVLAVLERIVRDAKELQEMGVGVAAICSNDSVAYPADSFPDMKKLANDKGFSFPYLHDETQAVARAWRAACTPDFFGFNAAGQLQYRGRLDASGTKAEPDARRELFEAMKRIAQTGQGPREQTPSMGCSIKWKAA